MAGIYIHIPFCQRRCIYCDFFSTTHLERREDYLHALKKEISLRKDYLGDKRISTIYMGGGTPSQLSESQIRTILEAIKDSFNVEKDAEITIEANPDDVHKGYPSMLQSMGINRISMGIQTFDDGILGFMGRRHNATGAIQAVKTCQKEGLRNISIDLMYGLPGQTTYMWEKDIDKALELDVPHMSAYHLIYEEGTRMSSLLDSGKITQVSEATSLAMFELLVERLSRASYIHYEISNFAKEGYHSRHNSSYWEGVPYLGLGAAAHSFSGRSREWNIASLDGYINGIQKGLRVFETEELDEGTRYNEMIMTGLRTAKGVSVEKIHSLFANGIPEYFDKESEKHILNGLLIKEDGYIKLSHRGIFISDGIMSDLMFVN